MNKYLLVIFFVVFFIRVFAQENNKIEQPPAKRKVEQKLSKETAINREGLASDSSQQTQSNKVGHDGDYSGTPAPKAQINRNERLLINQEEYPKTTDKEKTGTNQNTFGPKKSQMHSPQEKSKIIPENSNNAIQENK